MNLSDKVKDIKAAKEENKLVIFVGAGVSKNSGIPTWSGLIKEFAKKQNYDKCEECTHKKKGCKHNECQERYDFTQDEYLKIPQYFFNNCKSKGHKKYYNLISDTLKSDNKANPLDDIIMKLLPKHIITTNYDKLLENSKVPTTMLYDVIVEDKDLLIHNSNNYLIKMHGDICNPKTIVLKEDDYINYQQEHILIETYIKSLLIDHTFLFVGYSINDYNLKLILGWIEYLAKENAVNENRPKNYVIQVENTPIKEHIEKYFSSKNIFIINTYDLPSKILEKYKDIDLPEQGKKVYAVLDYIYDDKIDYLFETFSEILLEKYKIFSPFKKISFKDFISVYSFGAVENKGGTLYFYNKEEFEKLKPIILSTEEKEKSIKEIFLKAGISSIQYNEDFLPLNNEDNGLQTVDDELFQLYLNNEYYNIIAKLNNIKDDNLVAYYYYLILPFMGNLNIKLDEIEKNIIYKNNLYNLVIYKYNRILFKKMNSIDTSKDWKEFRNIIDNIPNHDKKAYGFIKRLSDGMSEEKLECSNLFEDHKKQFLKTDDSTIYGYKLGKLPELQGIAYDYYYNIKYNNLMLDYFSNPEKFFEPYIKAILCTYSSLKERRSESFFGYSQYLEEYKLNSIDFDILIKYTNKKLLKSWMSDYKVKFIKLESDVNVVNKFISLCNTMKMFGHKFNNTQLSNYLLIITKCNLINEDKEKIIISLAKLIERDGDKVNGITVNIINDIAYVVNFYKDEKINSLYNILNTLLHNETIKLINERRFDLSKVFRNLFKYSDANTCSSINTLIDSQNDISEKLKMIYTLHYLFSNTQKLNYMIIVKDNISLIKPENLFEYIVDKYISFDESIKKQFINIIEKEIEARKISPGVVTFPDWLKLAIECCIMLHLLKIWENVDCLRPFIDYSDCLAFILDSKNFDYSKVDTNNYIWQNIFRNKEYNNILIAHKNDIATSDLKMAVDNGYATDNQKKILYKYLLSDNELWNIN